MLFETLCYFFTLIICDLFVSFRSHSAFARLADQLEWPVELEEGTVSWFHVSGITPLLGDAARKSWLAAVQHARRLNVPTSLDLNYRPQLGVKMKDEATEWIQMFFFNEQKCMIDAFDS